MELGKLSVTKVEKTKKAGMYGDGGGLCLRALPLAESGCASILHRVE